MTRRDGRDRAAAPPDERPSGPGPEDLRTDDVQDPDVAGTFVRDTAVMSVGTAISRLTGFLRLAAMVYAIGITESWLSTAYNVANTTPNIVYELVLGGILTSVVVPVLVEWLDLRGRDEAWDVARRLFTFALVTLSVVAVVAIVFAPLIADLYTSGVPATDREEVHELATFFLRWFMPQIVFYGIGAIAIGLLNAHRRFAAPMFAPILNNVIVIATFVVYVLLRPDGASGAVATTLQKYVLAIGTTAGVVGMTIVLWPSLRALGFRFAWVTGWRHEAVRKIASLAKWVLVYVAANQIGFLVVIVLANRDSPRYPVYAAAFILFQLPHAIFVVSIFTALLPAMSGRWAAGDVAGFRNQLAQGIRATAAVVIAAALGFIVLARPIVALLLEHGVVEQRSGRLVADVLVAFAIGLFPFSAFQLLLRASYAMQDTRTPAIVNIGALVVNVVANLVFFFGFDLGVQGLALGHATSYVFASIVLLVLVRRRLGGIEGRRIVTGLSRTFVAAALTAGAAWLVARFAGEVIGTETLVDQSIQVLGAVVVGMVVYLVAAAILHIDEVAMVRRQLLRRFVR
jgi:putative peptidoglycan lipid II flippase